MLTDAGRDCRNRLARPNSQARTRTGVLFGVLGSRCLTGSALLDCHVLKGFGIYMIGILDSLSDVSTGTHHVIHSLI